MEGLERLLSPRVHFKAVVVDGTFAYSGSANLTGAGMGAKSENRRNFEVGFITSAQPLSIRLLSNSMNYGWENSAGLAKGNNFARSSIDRCEIDDSI